VLLTRSLNAVFSPGGRHGRLSTLIFHRVLAQPDPLFPEEPDARRFDELMSWVGASFNVVPLDQALTQLRAGTLPPRALAITFDDGYADNCEIAMPILRRHGMNATFFVATEFLDGGRMWNDTIIEAIRRTAAQALNLSDLGLGTHDLSSVTKRRQAIDRLLPAIKYLALDQRRAMVDALAQRCAVALPNDLMMTSGQVCELRDGGMSIGGHTCSHPILARLDEGAARDEIVENKSRLERMLGQAIELFAYPNGKPGADYLARDVGLVREAGYRFAVSTSPGVARRDCDPFQIPRFTPWDRTQFRFGIRMARNMFSANSVAA